VLGSGCVVTPDEEDDNLIYMLKMLVMDDPLALLCGSANASQTSRRCAQENGGGLVPKAGCLKFDVWHGCPKPVYVYTPHAGSWV
jgi:hypothetical protein